MSTDAVFRLRRAANTRLMDTPAAPCRVPLLVAVALSLSATTGCDLYV
jgi:hypothetical protein